LHWLHGIGAGLVQIGYDCELITAIGPQGLNDPRLRRAQALAPWNGIGPAITRVLLLTKLQGQASVLRRIPNAGRAIATIEGTIAELSSADEIHRMRTVEAKGALMYWRGWEHVPVPWARRDEPHVPEHRRTFGARMSPLSVKPRYAVNPPNAILNYLYAVLEAETTIAARAVGLDPGMGLLHVDEHGRDSLTLDLMEVVRPQVDAYLLGLLQGPPFASRMFFETEKGVCRVMPPLSHALAQTGPTWQQAIAPVVEHVARTLHYASRDIGSVAPKSLSGTPISARSWREPPTRLTKANKLASATKLKAPRRPKRRLVCGVVLEGDGRIRRRYCDDCSRVRKSEAAKATQARLSARPYAER
jgi:CRISPR-associated endonuclease Cas1